jgi:hypothetical protein
MKILDRFPYYDTTTLLEFGSHTVEIRPYQIAIWVRIDRLAFPAVLDTGHSHHFMISERLLVEWAGVASLRRIGDVLVNKSRLPQFASDLWILHNKPRTRELGRGGTVLRLDQGITVVPEGSPASTRLPVLGLRALAVNRVRIVIDGARGYVSLSKPGGFRLR